MGTDYKEIDGGVYDNLDVSIREALNDIVEDLKENPFDNDELIPIDYDGYNWLSNGVVGNYVCRTWESCTLLFHVL